MQKLIRRLYEAEVWEDCRFLDINRFSGRIKAAGCDSLNVEMIQSLEEKPLKIVAKEFKNYYIIKYIQKVLYY